MSDKPNISDDEKKLYASLRGADSLPGARFGLVEGEYDGRRALYIVLILEQDKKAGTMMFSPVYRQIAKEDMDKIVVNGVKLMSVDEAQKLHRALIESDQHTKQ